MTNYEENTEDGGPAFSCAAHSPEYGPMYQSGMSLRDWFAGIALQGMLAGIFSDQYQSAQFNLCAEEAYNYADAMLAKRKYK